MPHSIPSPHPTPSHDWRAALPAVRGTLRQDFALAGSTWFQVGGIADMFFKPEDAEDLAQFFAALPPDVPVLVMGVGSNLLVRDGGVRGVVIRLGRGFTSITYDATSQQVTAGAGALGRNVAQHLQPLGRGGLEFLTGIPGTVGGAVAMNAGAYGREVVDCLHSVTLVHRNGRLETLAANALHMRYRKGNLPTGAIVVSACFHTQPSSPDAVTAAIAEIAQKREESQPLRTRTGGSTFKNPEGQKAWQLIDAAGCRGLRRGDAQVSDKHCNFLLNLGRASAADIEALGEEVRHKVQQQSGITLEWEIQRVGDASIT